MLEGCEALPGFVSTLLNRGHAAESFIVTEKEFENLVRRMTGGAYGSRYRQIYDKMNLLLQRCGKELHSTQVVALLVILVDERVLLD